MALDGPKTFFLKLVQHTARFSTRHELFLTTQLVKHQLSRRGPDTSSYLSRILNENWTLFCATHVLWMQGERPKPQPVVDQYNNILLWNGDVFGIRNRDKVDFVNDTEFISHLLCQLCTQQDGILEVLADIEGPWSFVYWNERYQELWFGRDALGRHSLLWWLSDDSPGIVLSSTASRIENPTAKEVPAIGIFVASITENNMRISLYPWSTTCLETATQLYSPEDFIPNLTISKMIPSPYPCSNVNIPDEEDEFLLQLKNLTLSSTFLFDSFFDNLLEDKNVIERVQKFSEILLSSVSVRCHTQPQLCKFCSAAHINREDMENCCECKHSKVAVLFSGGLDSAVIALLSDSCIPAGEPIDLINVAFSIRDREVQTCHTTSFHESTVLKTDPEFDVPDRLLSKTTFQELITLRPNRKWQYVEVNVSKTELKEQRDSRIADLIYPKNTVLDDSLGCALWFAARGKGILHHEHGNVIVGNYNSPARVLLLGMGADELLGGYASCRKLLTHSDNWLHVAESLNRALLALPTRNLGRDDRVVCDSGRQARFPYLAENVIRYLVQLPAHLRTVPLPTLPPGLGEKLLLRLLARHLGFRSAACAPKRALQFGSRLAGLEARNERGDDVCPRLVDIT